MKEMKQIWYKLDGKNPIPCEDSITWAEWFDKTDRKVMRTNMGDVVVSTVFLGLDHQWGDGPPLLFETMIFGGEHDGYCNRYSTWEESEEGHTKACKMVTGAKMEEE